MFWFIMARKCFLGQWPCPFARWQRSRVQWSQYSMFFFDLNSSASTFSAKLPMFSIWVRGRYFRVDVHLLSKQRRRTQQRLQLFLVLLLPRGELLALLLKGDGVGGRSRGSEVFLAEVLLVGVAEVDPLDNGDEFGAEGALRGGQAPAG